MIDFKSVVITPAFSKNPLAVEAARLAQELATVYKTQFKIAIVRSKAIATGKTLKSVAIGKILDSPSRGIFKRTVSASRSWIYIQKGRRADAKFPIRRVGNKFEPVPELKEWFIALGIPKAAWFPIIRKIARDGIRPRKIRERMMRDARPLQAKFSSAAGNRIAKQLSATATRQVFTS